VVHHAVGPVVIDGPHSEVSFEFAKRVFDFEQAAVVGVDFFSFPSLATGRLVCRRDQLSSLSLEDGIMLLDAHSQEARGGGRAGKFVAHRGSGAGQRFTDVRPRLHVRRTLHAVVAGGFGRRTEKLRKH
jgi:hypothetical protein